MKTKVSLTLALFGCFTVVAGCSSAPEKERLGVAHQAVAALPRAGFLPYPIKLKKQLVLDAGGVPVSPAVLNSTAAVEQNLQSFTRDKTAGGDVQRAWGGRLGDLYAADAYAQCATTGPAHRVKLFTDGTPTVERHESSDTYLRLLHDLMDDNVCTTLDPGVDLETRTDDVKAESSEILGYWRASRRTRSCNIDTSTAAAAAVDVIGRTIDPLYTSLDWRVNNPFGLLGTAPLIADALKNAVWVLDYADLNLCMALQLRESLNGADVLFASADELLYLQGIVRDRAQLATLQYALIAKVLAAPSGYSKTITDSSKYLVALRAWADSLFPSQLMKLGQDSALATAILVDSAGQMADLLGRRASARRSSDVPTFGLSGQSTGYVGNGGEQPVVDWGVSSARLRILNLMYGGEPLGGLGNSLNLQVWPYQAPGAIPSIRSSSVFVREPVSEPQVAALFGLARGVATQPGSAERGALQLKRVASIAPLAKVSAQPVLVDEDASALHLYRRVEVDVRQRECQQAQNGSVCDASSIWRTLPAAAGFAPLTGQYQGYRVFERYRVEPKHALSLVRALSQSLGTLPQASGLTYANRDFGRTRSTRRSYQPGPQEWTTYLYETPSHVTGKHAIVTLDPDPGDGVDTTESWLEVDPAFTLQPFTATERATPYLVEVPWPRTMYLEGEGHWGAVTGINETAGGALNHKVGVVSVLTYAREALVTVDPASNGFFPEASKVVSVIESAIGTKTMAVRGQTVLNPTTKTVEQKTSGSNNLFVVDIIEPSTTPAETLVMVPNGSRGLQTGTRDKNFTMFGETKSARDQLDAISPIASSVVAGLNAPVTGGLTLRSFEFTPQRPAAPAAGPPQYADALFLKTGTGETASYLTAHTDGITTLYNYGLFFSWGGSLNSFVDRVMATQAVDWSKPAYDGFGIPTDWLPPSDASLIGGTEGEDSYHYYLRSAKDAAQSATAAVQTAIDSLTEQVKDSQALTAAQERSRTLAGLEVNELCGTGADCNIPKSIFRLTLDPSSCARVAGAQPIGGSQDSVASAVSYCKSDLQNLEATLPAISLPTTVLSAQNNLQPIFSQTVNGKAITLRNGKLLDVLLKQWSALESLSDSLDQHVDSLVVSGTEIALAVKEATVARQDLAKAEADELTPFASLIATIPGLFGKKLALEEAEAREKDQRKVLFDAAYFACRPEAFNEAKWAGNGVKAAVHVLRADTAGVAQVGTETEACYEKNKALKGQALLFTCAADGYFGGRNVEFNPATHVAQMNTCRAAAGQLEAYDDPTGDLKVVRDTQHAAIQAEIYAAINLTKIQKDALMAASQAARDRISAAETRVQLAYENAGVQSHTRLNAIFERVRDMVRLSAEVAQIRLEAKNANQRNRLEGQLAAATSGTQSGLRRQFRSYDLWRAKALLEGARRLGGAARRAIESRFVLDLSQVTDQQTFVAAPSTWADEIFDADLNAPSVVGLSVFSGTSNGTVYANKLQDYVDNLERFVQGYTISNPVSVAGADTEVVSFPAPNAAFNLDSPLAVTTSMIAPESQGWSFYCPETTQWYPNPTAGNRPDSFSTPTIPGAVSPVSMDTLCNGLPPTLARYDFSLDPWGRLNSSIASEPFVQRHNVRWRRLAVNLVGTGIHDCSQAQSKDDCYSTSFLRYTLEHNGPSWVTNSDAEWRTMDVPAAFVEGGKAITTEEWLDPVSKGWNLPQIGAVARGELRGRPVSGSYSITLQLGPEVRLDRIERVQLLTETDYWVHQGDDRGIQESGGRRIEAPIWDPERLPPLVAWFSPRRGTSFDTIGPTIGALNTWVDQTANARVVTQTSTARPVVATDSGTSWLKFDGSDSLAIPDSVPLSPAGKATYAFWAAIPSSATPQYLLSQWGASQRIQVFRDAQGLINVNVRDSVASTTASSKTTVAVDTAWHFWTVEFKGDEPVANNRVKLYRDGVAQTLTVTGTVPTSLFDSTLPVSVGSDAGANFFSGKLGPLYILNDVLSYGDRLQLMAFESPVAPWSPRQEDSLVGWWSPRKDFRLETDGTVSVVGDMGAFNNDAVQNTAASRPARVIESGAPALAFTSGSAKNLVVADSPSLSWTQKGTYAFWARVDASQDFLMLDQTQGGLPTTRFTVRYYNDSQVLVQVNGATAEGAVSIAGRSDYRNWHFYVVQFDGAAVGNAARLRLFIDGVPKSITFTGTVPAALVDSTLPLTIGDYRPAGFNGRIGSVYVFNNVLDDNRRSLLMEYEAPYSKAVPMSALQVWMDPTIGLTKVGTTTQISSWANQGLFASSLTASGTVSVNNVIGGQSSIYFPGGASFLTSGTMTGLLPAGSDATVITVAKPEVATALGDIRAILDLEPTTTTTNQAISLFHYVNATVGPPGQMTFRVVSGNTDAKGNYGDFPTAHVLIGRHTLARRDLYVDGKLIGSSTDPVLASQQLGANFLRLGGLFNPNPYGFQGELGDTLIWPRALSNAEINRVTQYLSGKYQIPVTALP